jgi:hypothetical protein
MTFFPPQLTARFHPKTYSKAYKSQSYKSAGETRMPWGSTNIVLSKNKETTVFTTSLQSKLLVTSMEQKPGHYLSLSKCVLHR